VDCLGIEGADPFRHCSHLLDRDGRTLWDQSNASAGAEKVVR
jgi:hypothetical protein